MSTEMGKMKLMICKFQKDGSTSFVYDADITDEPFMGIIQDAINDIADEWFKFVKDSKEAKTKVYPFRMVVRI